MSAPVCPYCRAPAKLVTGAEAYPQRSDLATVRVWICRPCGARVGCHPGTDVPLGTLADAELRRARAEAHDAFDVRWARKGPRVRQGWTMTRTDAYLWLAKQLGLGYADCHIGSFDLATCRRVVEICRAAKS